MAIKNYMNSSIFIHLKHRHTTLNVGNLRRIKIDGINMVYTCIIPSIFVSYSVKMKHLSNRETVGEEPLGME